LGFQRQLGRPWFELLLFVAVALSGARTFQRFPRDRSGGWLIRRFPTPVDPRKKFAMTVPGLRPEIRVGGVRRVFAR
jgi:hypothetical protein